MDTGYRVVFHGVGFTRVMHVADVATAISTTSSTLRSDLRNVYSSYVAAVLYVGGDRRAMCLVSDSGLIEWVSLMNDEVL